MRESSQPAPIMDLTRCGTCGERLPADRAGLDECGPCTEEHFREQDHLPYDSAADWYSTGADEIEYADES